MSLKGIKILFVEDDPVFQNVISSFLKQRGAIVQFCSTAEEGVEFFVQDKFDLILADLKLPKMDGLMMLQVMSRHNSSVPSIVISASELMNNVTEALRIGASDYIVKPIQDLFTVEKAINSLLEIKPTTDDNSELNEHIDLIAHNPKIAKKIQAGIYPNKISKYEDISVNYTIYAQELTPYLVDSILVGDENLVIYSIKLSYLNSNTALATILLQSLINNMVKLWRQNLNLDILNPEAMLKYLHKNLLSSGIGVQIEIFYFHLNIKSKELKFAHCGNELRCFLVNQQLLPFLLKPSTKLGADKFNTNTYSLNLNDSSIAILSDLKYESAILNRDFRGLSRDLVENGMFLEIENIKPVLPN